LDTLPDVKWRHVPTKQNPADYARRGVKSSDLLNNSMWFYCSKFLTMNLNEWPNSEASDDTAEELRVPYQVALISTKSNDVIEMMNERISKFSRMCRIFAYVCRAIKCFR